MSVGYNLLLAAEIIVGTISGLYAIGFSLKGIRYLMHGPDKDKPIDYAFIAYQMGQAGKEGYLHRFLVVFDIFCNVCAKGNQDETISGRSYRATLEGKTWGRVMNSFLNLYQPQHGVKAVIGDLYRAQSRVVINMKVLGLNK